MVSKLILHPDFNLYELEGRAYCDSLQVAEEFKKDHDDVLRAVRNLTHDAGENFSLRNFEERTRTVRGRKYPIILMSKDGFMTLVFGFTGKKAMALKIAFIERFNAMEAFICSLLTAKMEYPAYTEAIKLAHENPQRYHFSNENNMIYVIVLGCNAKQFREAHGLKKDEVIRPYLTLEQIQAVETLQRIDIGLHEAGLDYEARKKILSSRYERMTQKLTA